MLGVAELSDDRLFFEIESISAATVVKDDPFVVGTALIDDVPSVEAAPTSAAIVVRDDPVLAVAMLVVGADTVAVGVAAADVVGADTVAGWVAPTTAVDKADVETEFPVAAVPLETDAAPSADVLFVSVVNVDVGAVVVTDTVGVAFVVGADVVGAIGIGLPNNELNAVKTFKTLGVVAAGAGAAVVDGVAVVAVDVSAVVVAVDSVAELRGITLVSPGPCARTLP